ncbi:MAG: hypothetical protein MJZ66_10270 [Bacteroidales bacterium]|nr:hypothetical protein [Bacteroidales bacterium]
MLSFFVLDCNAQSMDGNCHIDVFSGSPVLFQFHNVDEMRQGKTLVYNSLVRVFVVKPLKWWKFYAKSISPVFDGPSELNSSIINLEIKQLRMDNDFVIGPGDVPGTYTYSPTGKIALNPDKTLLAEGTLSTGIYKNYALYFYIQFSIEPSDSDEKSQLINKNPGYYASQAVFWMEYDLRP